METIENNLEASSTNSAEDKTEPILQKNIYASEVSRRQYLNKRTADVFFTFEGSNERIPAHKSVLAAASGVFDKMFFGSMVVNGDVSLPGKSAEAFKNFLQFCYLDQVELNSDSITDVMSLLHEYQMKEGLVVCGQFLAENWTVENICSVYDWAINLQIDELQAFCERKIGMHSYAVFKTDGFLSCSFNVVDHILAFDSLMCDETVVLGACLDWARHQCKQNGKDETDMKNLREYLTNNFKNENLLCKIRYGSIAHAELLMHLDAVDGFFTDAKENEDLLRVLLGSKNSKTGKFLTEPRKSSNLDWNEEALECDLMPNPRLSQETFNSQRIANVITVDGLMLLEGFYNVPLFLTSGPSSFSAEFLVKEQPIYGNNESKSILKGRITFKDNQEKYCQFSPKSITLKPDYEYHFEFCFESSNIRYDRFELSNVIKLNEHNSIYCRSQGAENGPFIIKKLKLKLPN